MEKRGERLQTSWEREQSACASKTSSGRKGISLLGRFLRGAMAVLLAAGILPLVPGSPAVEKAQGLEGTTKYEDLFNIINFWGKAGNISGQTLTSGSTYSSSDYEFTYGAVWQSCALFVSKKPVSLLNSWEVSFQGSSSPLEYLVRPEYNKIAQGFHPGLTSTPTVRGGTTYVWDYVAERTGSGVETCDLRLRHVESDTCTNSIAASWRSFPAIRFCYDAKENTGTIYIDDAYRLSIPNVRATFGNSAYLLLGGYIAWYTSDEKANAPAGTVLASTFSSMFLPNLTPEIREVKIYRTDGTEIGRVDYVKPGDKVRVECTVRNANTAAVSDKFSEQFPMHLKLADTTAHPTKGLTPFADGNHPVQVNGSTVATSLSDDTIQGANGVPVTLVGNDATTVSWWATVSGAQGGAVTLSQQLIEDSFGGSVYSTVELVDERPLTPGGGGEGVDPNDPSTWGDAGKDYHYTRLPAANANGWNSSPVTVTFYPGDYDVMDLTPSQGSAKSLTAADPAWTQSADTTGVDLSAQAKNTDTGAVSVTRAGKVKIDSDAPRLTVTGRALGSYAADDTPTDASKVSSGLWRLHRTGASGAASDATAYRTFDTTGSEGDLNGANQTESLANLPNGYYVAEDAAGNRSTPLKVGDTEPPTVERPDLDGPDAPDPAGPPYDPAKDPVPSPTETEGEDGLRHAVIDETVTEIIDPASPPFEGSLDETDAKAMMDYRYAASSAATIASTTDELLDASGNPISSLDTKAPGECLVRRVITDDQGNTTTINLHYRCVRDSCPPVSPLQPVDPDAPTGPKQPGDPLQPDGPVTTDPDGSQHVEVSADVTEAVTRGVMDASDAEDLLRRHFALADADGGTGVTLTVQSMENASGNRISSIDLSRVANYKITYLVRDATGNTTTVRLGYHLVSSRVPGVVMTPDPGTDPNPQPGDDPLNPKPRPIDPPYPPEVAPDGTQHATIEDEMRVKVQEGVSLDLADVRSLVERRYDFTPEGGGSVTELSLSIADAKGVPATAIDLSRPGSWLITYKIADANGNTVTIHLRYLVVSGAPEVTPTPGGDGTGGGTGGDSGDDGTGGGPGGGADPLPPISTVVDPETGLTHSVVEDTVVVGTSDEAATPENMAQFLAERYAIASALSDGALDRGPVQLFDASGNPVTQIDRTKPGDWLAVQVVTDSAGNTTTIRVKYLVREGDVSGGISGNGQGNGNGSGAGSGSAQNGGAGSSTDSGEGHGSKLATRIHQLPQTGGIFGPCPLHIMFVLIMVLASAYTMMRLRQESSRREDRRHNAEWEEASHEFA